MLLGKSDSLLGFLVVLIKQFKKDGSDGSSMKITLEYKREKKTGKANHKSLPLPREVE